jgi:hypothetical protein
VGIEKMLAEKAPQEGRPTTSAHHWSIIEAIDLEPMSERPKITAMPSPVSQNFLFDGNLIPTVSSNAEVDGAHL